MNEDILANTGATTRTMSSLAVVQPHDTTPLTHHEDEIWRAKGVVRPPEPLRGVARRTIPITGTSRSQLAAS